MQHRIHPLTWILTADGHHARVWEWRNRDEPLSLVSDFVSSAENAKSFSRDLKSDRPGRSFASTGARRSAIEPRHDPHDLEKQNFARKLAGNLDEALQQNRFHRLVIIAPPHMLGDLRNCFSNQIRKVVIGESDKDFMNADVEALYYHVAQLATPA